MPRILCYEMAGFQAVWPADEGVALNAGYIGALPILIRRECNATYVFACSTETFVESRVYVVAQASITRTRITPEDRPIEVRIFLAALSAGQCVLAALRLSGLSERRVSQWIAFCGFGAAVQRAKRKGRRARLDVNGLDALRGLVDLNAAIMDRQEQQIANRYAGWDRERLEQMRSSGELDRIWIREAIETLRSYGKHELADYTNAASRICYSPESGREPVSRYDLAARSEGEKQGIAGYAGPFCGRR